MSHPSDKDKGDEIDDDENYLFDFASRRIKDAFYAHGGSCARVGKSKKLRERCAHRVTVSTVWNVSH